MKVPPKRKGNEDFIRVKALAGTGLNESPSEKEGKLAAETAETEDADMPQ